MIFKVDDETVFTLAEWQKTVLKDEILTDEFDADMKRRVKYIIEHKFLQCYNRLKEEWMKKFEADSEITMIPTDPEAFVALVVSQPSYKSRSQREAEALNQV